jgi:hypothetical protein
MEAFLLIGLILLLGSRGSSAPSQVNPISYTQSPAAYLGGSLNAAGSIGVPILSSALNGFGRPLTGSFGIQVGGPQSDPAYGNPGSTMIEIGGDTSPGINPGSIITGTDGYDPNASMAPLDVTIGP